MKGFEDIGLVALPIVLFAGLGALITIVGFALSFGRSPTARSLGAGAVLAGIACATLGGGVAIDARRTADKAVLRKDMDADDRLEARRREYQSIKGAPRFGLSFAAPLMASGALVWLIASRKKKGAPESSNFTPPARRFGVPIALSIGSLGSLALAHIASLTEIPGGVPNDIAVGSPAYRLFSACEDVGRAKDPEDLRAACGRLEGTLANDDIPPAELRSIAVLRERTRRCIEVRREEASRGPSLTYAEMELTRLSMSWLLRGDKPAEELISGDLEEVKALIKDQQEEAQPDPFGEVKVRGAISVGEVRRIVRNDIGYFRICAVSARGPAHRGHIKVMFHVDEAGAVSAVSHSSTLRDEEVGNCFERRARSLPFDKRKGRNGDVTYTFRITPSF